MATAKEHESAKEDKGETLATEQAEDQASRVGALKKRYSAPPANKHKKPTKSMSSPMKH